MEDYQLVRSKRRTVSIYVRNGGVEVRAPLKMPIAEIERFVASKEEWITDKLKASMDQQAQRESFHLDYGDLITYRGRQYPIVSAQGRRAGFDGERFFLPPNLLPEQIRAVCVKIYRMLAKGHLTERTCAYAAQMSVNPAGIRISSAKTRWGSCSAKGNVNFSWRLVMADDSVIDYVVVHELAHLKEMNHSERFWGIVAGVLPDHKKRKAKLRSLQRRLNGEAWD